jgi:hypothetical protein
MRKIFHFVSDPGHGWLKVPVAELERLGIADQITRHSYIKDQTAYLEEDIDMATFINARNAADEPVEIKTFNRNRQSRIRNYDSYRGDQMVIRTNLMTGEEFQERADTPLHMSPSSETYWSA